MLVLTRKLHEQISIGQNITITVLRLKGNTVRIGIDAPNDVRVVRGELPRFDGEEEPPRPSQRRTPASIETPTAPIPPQRASGQRVPSTGLKPLVERITRRADCSNQDLLEAAAAATLLVD